MKKSSFLIILLITIVYSFNVYAKDTVISLNKYSEEKFNFIEKAYDVEGKHLIIIEDIIDSGTTMNYLMKYFKERKPKSVKLCSLLSKPSRRVVDVNIDYCGFEVPDEFLVGYGLDYAEVYRNLPYIGVLKPEIYA